VYLNEVSPGRYDFFVQGERGVITAHRGWSYQPYDVGTFGDVRPPVFRSISGESLAGSERTGVSF
jgi:hypothetical protein